MAAYRSWVSLRSPYSSEKLAAASSKGLKSLADFLEKYIDSIVPPRKASPHPINRAFYEQCGPSRAGFCAQVRLSCTLDEERVEVAAKSHAGGYRTARENFADLVDADSFAEYGHLAVSVKRK